MSFWEDQEEKTGLRLSSHRFNDGTAGLLVAKDQPGFMFYEN